MLFQYLFACWPSIADAYGISSPAFAESHGLWSLEECGYPLCISM